MSIIKRRDKVVLLMLIAGILGAAYAKNPPAILALVFSFIMYPFYFMLLPWIYRIIWADPAYGTGSRIYLSLVVTLVAAILSIIMIAYCSFPLWLK